MVDINDTQGLETQISELKEEQNRCRNHTIKRLERLRELLQNEDNNSEEKSAEAAVPVAN